MGRSNGQFGCKEIDFKMPAVPGRPRWAPDVSAGTGRGRVHAAGGQGSAASPHFTWLGRHPTSCATPPSCRMGVAPVCGRVSLRRVTAPMWSRALSTGISHLLAEGRVSRKSPDVQPGPCLSSGTANTLTSKLICVHSWPDFITAVHVTMKSVNMFHMLPVYPGKPKHN